MHSVQVSDFRAGHREIPTAKTVNTWVGEHNINSLTWGSKALNSDDDLRQAPSHMNKAKL